MKNNQFIDKKVLTEIENICLDEKYEIKIEIGEIVLSIKTNDYELDRLMKKKFCAFLSTGPAELFIEIQVKDKIQIQLEKISMEVAIDDYRIFFNRSFYCAGIIDFRGKKSRMLVIPPLVVLPMEDVIEGIICLILSYLIIDFEGVCLHAASIVVDSNKGFIFCGKSGCGKTTIANLSNKYTVLSDEISFIRKINNEYKVYSTPFHPNTISTYSCALIESILFPRKNNEVYLKKVPVHSSVKEMMKNGYLVFQAIPFPFRYKFFSVCGDIVEKILSYELYFLPNESFWWYILNRREKKEGAHHNVEK